LVGGIREDVLLGPVVNFIADVLPGSSSEELDNFVQSVEGRPLVTAANTFGQIGAMLLAFTPASLAGRAAASAALRVLARSATAANPAIKGVTQLGKVAMKAEDIGGDIAKAIPRLGIERAAEVLGSSGAFGLLAGVEAGLEGKPKDEIMEEAAIAFALGAAFETAIVGLGLFTKKGRAAFTDRNDMIKEAAKLKGTIGADGSFLPGEGKTIADIFQGIREEAKLSLDDAAKKLNKLLDTDHTVMQLVAPGGKSDDLLKLVQATPNLTAKQIARHMDIDIDEAGRMIKKLQKSGYISSRTVPGRLKPVERKLRLPEAITSKIRADRAVQKFNLRPEKAIREVETIERRKLFVRDPATGKRVLATTKGAPRQIGPDGKPLHGFRPEDKAAINDLLQARNEAKNLYRAATKLERDPLVKSINKVSPFSASEKRRELIKFMRRYITTPEGAQGSGGVVANKVLQAVKRLDDMNTIAMGVMYSNVKKARNSVFQALRNDGATRLSKRQLNKQIQDGLLLQLGDAFELSTKGTTDKLVDFLVKNRGFSKQVVKVGGKGPIDFVSTGVNHYWPHIFRSMGEDEVMMEIIKLGKTGKITPTAMFDTLGQMFNDPDDINNWAAMVKSFGLDPNDIRSAADLHDRVDYKLVEQAIQRFFKAGPEVRVKTRMTRFNSIDASRSIRGTMLSKHEAGLPVSLDIFDSALRYLHAGSRRVLTAQVFGSKGQLVDEYVKAITIEAGVQEGKLFKGLIENYLHNDFYSESMRTASKWLTSSNVFGKMSLGVVANMTQPSLNIMTSGVMNTTKGLFRALNKEDRARLQQMMALHHSMVADVGRVLGEEGLGMRAIERLAEGMLKWTGFSMFESGNRLWSGGVGYAVTKDIIIKGAVGRLRGRALDDARRMASELDFSLDDIITKVRATNPRGGINLEKTLENVAGFLNKSDEGRVLMDRSAFLQAQRTQFIPSKFRRPEVWNHPMGRVMFQFKTFSMQMSRFLRDSVLAEAAIGNVKPLAYFLGVGALTGEYVADVRAYIRGDSRPDNLPARVLENTFSMGGFALAGDAFQAVRFGDPLGFALGPSVDSGIDVINSAYQAIFNQDLSPTGNMMARLPVFQAAHALFSATMVTPELLGNYLDTEDRDVVGPRITSPRSSRSPAFGTQADLLLETLRNKRRGP
jgi:hypothetical protein